MGSRSETEEVEAFSAVSPKQENVSTFMPGYYLLGFISKCRSEITLELGMVVHSYNPSTWEVDQEDQEFKASLSYMSSKLTWAV